MLWCFLYHQAVTTGFQGAQTDAEQDCCGEGVVINEASALGVSVATVQGQIGVGVAREKHRAEVDLQGDGLNSTVHTDVPLTCRHRGRKVTSGSFWVLLINHHSSAIHTLNSA